MVIGNLTKNLAVMKKMLERESFTKTFFCDEFGNKVYLTYSLKGVKEKKVVHP